MTYRDASGEIATEPTWTVCRVCGVPTAQAPVCFDYRCEVEYFGLVHD